MVTNVGGNDRVLLAVSVLEDFEQDLWRKPVDGNVRVPDRPIHLQTLRDPARWQKSVGQYVVNKRTTSVLRESDLLWFQLEKASGQ